MSAEPKTTFTHNTLWRKLRRRYFGDRFSLLALFSCLPALCSLSWLLHGPHWLTLLCGIGWFLTSVFMALFFWLMSTLIHKGTPLPAAVTKRSLAWGICLSALNSIVLLMGRIDLAFYLTYGPWSGEWPPKVFTKPLETTLRLLAATALCFAFAKHAIGWIIALLIFQWLQPYRFRPALREVIRQLPARAEYVARRREACSTGGG